jgi:radical SAM/Cys-rich protein
VNLGYRCNQTCVHCHVNAGPNRKETMTRETVDQVLEFMQAFKLATVDLTGGAPELNPNFDYIVESAVSLGRHVIDRCNLTVIFEPGKEYLPEFFERNRVELICSLPCYSQGNVDRQRGKGTFESSIRALRVFNSLGYGRPGSDLVLNLVYNPVGPHLPPPQKQLEQDYRRDLWEKFGIEFNNLFCLTNMPITRFEKFLKARGQYDRYLALLAAVVARVVLAPADAAVARRGGRDRSEKPPPRGKVLPHATDEVVRERLDLPLLATAIAEREVGLLRLRDGVDESDLIATTGAAGDFRRPEYRRVFRAIDVLMSARR